MAASRVHGFPGFPHPIDLLGTKLFLFVFVFFLVMWF